MVSPAPSYFHFLSNHVFLCSFLTLELCLCARNASKSFNFSQLLRGQWRQPPLRVLRHAAQIEENENKNDKSIWIDKCHQNRSGIKFIIPSGLGRGKSKWMQGYRYKDTSGLSWQHGDWQTTRRRDATPSSINSSVRQFRRKQEPATK